MVARYLHYEAMFNESHVKRLFFAPALIAWEEASEGLQMLVANDKSTVRKEKEIPFGMS